MDMNSRMEKMLKRQNWTGPGDRVAGASDSRRTSDESSSCRHLCCRLSDEANRANFHFSSICPVQLTPKFQQLAWNILRRCHGDAWPRRQLLERILHIFWRGVSIRSISQENGNETLQIRGSIRHWRGCADAIFSTENAGNALTVRCACLGRAAHGRKIEGAVCI